MNNQTKEQLISDSALWYLCCDQISHGCNTAENVLLVPVLQWSIAILSQLRWIYCECSAKSCEQTSCVVLTMDFACPAVLVICQFNTQNISTVSWSLIYCYERMGRENFLLNPRGTEIDQSNRVHCYRSSDREGMCGSHVQRTYSHVIRNSVQEIPTLELTGSNEVLQKLRATQLVKISATFYRIRRFIKVFITPLHSKRSQTSKINSCCSTCTF